MTVCVQTDISALNSDLTQRGSALVYILIAVALLAALTVSLMEPSSQQASSQNTTNLVSELRNQINFITSAIQECVLVYPEEDSGITAGHQLNPPFPLNPMDAYLPALTPAVTAQDVAFIRCPGNPGNNSAAPEEHSLIFGGSSGKFLPQPPPLMGQWQYYSGADGIYISISSSRSDNYILTAFQRLNDQFATCEADFFNQGGSAANMTSDTAQGDAGVRTCPANTKCFRYWIKLNTATSVHADGPSC